MKPEEIVKMIFEMLNDKIEKLGGEDTLIKAAAWKWWTTAPINDGDDLDRELKECEKAYETIMNYLEVEEFFGGDHEDSFNLPS